MEAKFSEIDADIKSGEFKRSYLLFGEETYLRRQYKHKLIGALVEDGDTMNFSEYEGSGISEGELIDLAETLPMFASRRVILVSDSGFFEKGAEELSKYMKESAQDTVFVFSESNVKKTSRMYKALKENGVCVDFSTPGEQVLQKWIAGKFKAERMAVSGSCIRLFIERCGESMEIMSNEFEKLVSYCAEKGEVSETDVENIVTVQISNHIFDMIDALTSGNKERAGRLYSELVALKEPPMRILYLVGREYNMLEKISLMQSAGISVSDMAQRLGIRDFVVRKRLGIAKQLDPEHLRGKVSSCVEADESVKTGRMGEQLALETVLFG